MKINECKYSVLMCVYASDNPEYLQKTIDGMLCQPILPDQFVLMVDEPVPETLRDIISGYEKNKELFTIVWMETKENESAAQKEKTLMGALISDIAITAVNYAAENKRISARQKQAEGIAAARQRGTKFGRPQVPLPDNFYEVQQQWREKKLTLRQAAKACNLASTTFYNKVKAMEKEDRILE